MKLVVGGAYQGKREFVRRMWGDAYWVAEDFHLRVRELLEEGRDVAESIEKLLAEHPDAVIILDEVGYGIVPVHAEDRRYREAVGRAGQQLAERAEEVYRVVCGIGTRIKPSC